MSELKERLWAVLSERGCEEAGLSYEEAAALIARLRAERLSGLCVITAEAASRLPRAKRPRASSKPRRSKKKSAP
jgi:hypothetical protein